MAKSAGSYGIATAFCWIIILFVEKRLRSDKCSLNICHGIHYLSIKGAATSIENTMMARFTNRFCRRALLGGKKLLV